MMIPIKVKVQSPFFSFSVSKNSCENPMLFALSPPPPSKHTPPLTALDQRIPPPPNLSPSLLTIEDLRNVNVTGRTDGLKTSLYNKRYLSRKGVVPAGACAHILYYKYMLRLQEAHSRLSSGETCLNLFYW